MPRPKGTPKTGGRKKGTRNLKTLVLRESLDRVGFDIIQELYDVFPDLDSQTKAKVLLSFLPFLFPKPASVQVSDLRTYKMMMRAEDAIFGNLDGGSESEYPTNEL